MIIKIATKKKIYRAGYIGLLAGKYLVFVDFFSNIHSHFMATLHSLTVPRG